MQEFKKRYPSDNSSGFSALGLDLKFAKNLIPICLPNDNEDWAGQTGWSTGWGRLYEKGKELICISTQIINDLPFNLSSFRSIPKSLIKKKSLFINFENQTIHNYFRY